MPSTPWVALSLRSRFAHKTLPKEGRQRTKRRACGFVPWFLTANETLSLLSRTDITQNRSKRTASTTDATAWPNFLERFFAK
jgi:hypothetical protein